MNAKQGFCASLRRAVQLKLKRMMTNPDFPILLTSARKKKGLTQAELAKLLQVPQSTIGRYENGSSKPTPKNLVRLAEALDVSTEHFHMPAGREESVDDVTLTKKLRILKTFTAGERKTIMDIIDAFEKRHLLNKKNRKLQALLSDKE